MRHVGSMILAILLLGGPEVSAAPAKDSPAPDATPEAAPAAPARGAPTPSSDPGSSAGAKAEEPTPAPPLRNHQYQFGFGVRGGTGFRVLMPYKEGVDCGDAGKRVCLSRQPAWLELSPSFGVTHGLEVLLDVRIGLEKDYTDGRLLYFAPGIKYYADPDGLFKFFATGQIVFEYEPQGEGSRLMAFDFGLRSALGFQLDFNRHIGVALQGGVLLGFARELAFTLDFALGIQGRI
jgi:hypothetical protein